MQGFFMLHLVLPTVLALAAGEYGARLVRRQTHSVLSASEPSEERADAPTDDTKVYTEKNLQQEAFANSNPTTTAHPMGTTALEIDFPSAADPTKDCNRQFTINFKLKPNCTHWDMPVQFPDEMIFLSNHHSIAAELHYEPPNSDANPTSFIERHVRAWFMTESDRGMHGRGINCNSMSPGDCDHGKLQLPISCEIVDKIHDCSFVKTVRDLSLTCDGNTVTDTPSQVDTWENDEYEPHMFDAVSGNDKLLLHDQAGSGDLHYYGDLWDVTMTCPHVVPQCVCKAVDNTTGDMLLAPGGVFVDAGVGAGPGQCTSESANNCTTCNVEYASVIAPLSVVKGDLRNVTRCQGTYIPPASTSTAAPGAGGGTATQLNAFGSHR